MSTPKIATLKKLKTISNLLDNAIAIPGTKYKFGLDPIIGLFPAVGDYITLFISGYIIYEAAKLGAKQETLVKMALNILIDSLVGTVPVAGDVFDLAWKANQQNIDLLEKELPALETTIQPGDGEVIAVNWLPIISIFGAIIAVIAISSFVVLWLLKLILAFLFS
jgi:Domain of unknown function (DUF4112)